MYDHLGVEWTLLALSPDASAARPWQDAAHRHGLPLTMLPLAGDEARELYGAEWP